jgi:hypothetical protein
MSDKNNVWIFAHKAAKEANAIQTLLEESDLTTEFTANEIKRVLDMASWLALWADRAIEALPE